MAYAAQEAYWNLPEPDKRSIYDDKAAAPVFDYYFGIGIVGLREDGKLTGRWLMEDRDEKAPHTQVHIPRSQEATNP